jgi:hypothetical protein
MMLKGLLGLKLGMTRIFTEDGLWIPVTLLQAGPCTVVQRKKLGQEGYEAVQVGFGDKKEKRCSKPMLHHFKNAGVTPKRYLKEFVVEGDNALKPGDEVRTDIFKKGDRVDVSGTEQRAWICWLCYKGVMDLRAARAGTVRISTAGRGLSAPVPTHLKWSRASAFQVTWEIPRRLFKILKWWM